MLAIKQNDTWKEKNLSAILDRLSKLRGAKQVEHVIKGDAQGVFVRKLGDVLELYCFNNDTQKLSNIMSRIDLTNPLYLIGPYSQAVFLSAFWQNKTPRNIYIAGYGGGRLGMVFNHYFPLAEVYGSDFDPNILTVARDYFGISEHALKYINGADSREDLHKLQVMHDIIFLDVFAGDGEHVNHLATVEFFELCKSNLSQEGVLAANLVILDDKMHQKIAAMQMVFKHCYVWEFDGAHVVFASEEPIELNELISRVSEFQKQEKLDYNLVEKAKMLKPLVRNEKIIPLTDSDL